MSLYGDKKDYEEYIKNNEFIEEKNYRLNIVNKMIKRVYKTCKNKILSSS